MQNEMRDRLIELIMGSSNYICDDTHLTERIADYLLANGVILPPVQIGQKVWYIDGGYYNAKYKKPREKVVTELSRKYIAHRQRMSEWGFIADGTRYSFSSIDRKSVV